MKEIFLEFRNKASENLGKILDKILDVPPTYEIAVQNLRHSKICTQTGSLTKTEVKEYINFHDGGVWGVNPSSVMVIQRYVECSECHAREKYLR